MKSIVWGLFEAQLFQVIVIVWDYIWNVMNGMEWNEWNVMNGQKGNRKIWIGDFLCDFGYREAHVIFPTFEV